jgi:hypothetical protein
MIAVPSEQADAILAAQGYDAKAVVLDFMHSTGTGSWLNWRERQARAGILREH